jgi:hypothetical protein
LKRIEAEIEEGEKELISARSSKAPQQASLNAELKTATATKKELESEKADLEVNGMFPTFMRFGSLIRETIRYRETSVGRMRNSPMPAVRLTLLGRGFVLRKKRFSRVRTDRVLLSRLILSNVGKSGKRLKREWRI